MHAEMQALDRLTRDPARPYVAVLGGAKVSDKIGVLRRLATQVDALLLGGGIANTFVANAGGQTWAGRWSSRGRPRPWPPCGRPQRLRALESCYLLTR